MTYLSKAFKIGLDVFKVERGYRLWNNILMSSACKISQHFYVVKNMSLVSSLSKLNELFFPSTYTYLGATIASLERTAVKAHVWFLAVVNVISQSFYLLRKSSHHQSSRNIPLQSSMPFPCVAQFLFLDSRWMSWPACW